MTLYEELKWRGLVKDVSSPEIEKKLNEEKITFYWGTDPTADSLASWTLLIISNSKTIWQRQDTIQFY